MEYGSEITGQKFNSDHLRFFRILFGLLEEQIKLNQILQEKLGNKTVDSKRANNENINGRGCEKKKGVDSSDKNRIKATTKEQAATKDVKVVEQEKVIGYDGKEYDKEELIAILIIERALTTKMATINLTMMLITLLLQFKNRTLEV